MFICADIRVNMSKVYWSENNLQEPQTSNGFVNGHTGRSFLTNYFVPHSFIGT